LDDVVRATMDWIDDLLQRLGWQDRDNAYSALIAALHALRDWLPHEEAIFIGACFPPLLRGLYYEGRRLPRQAKAAASGGPVRPPRQSRVCRSASLRLTLPQRG